MVRFKNRYILFEVLPQKPLQSIETNEKEISDVYKIISQKIFLLDF